MSNEDPIKRFRELLSVSPEDRATHELRILEGMFVLPAATPNVAAATKGVAHEQNQEVEP